MDAQIYKGDPRPPIPPCVLDVFWLLPTTHTRKHNKMRSLALRAVRHFTHVYFHARTAVNTHLMNHGYFDRGENPNTPNLSPMPQ